MRPAAGSAAGPFLWGSLAMIQTRLPVVPAALAARGVTLRPRTDDDCDFLRDVYVAYRWSELAATGWPEAVRLSFLHDQQRLQEAHYSQHYDGAAWGVIEVNGERAGRLYVLNTGLDLRIIDIAFLPQFCNQGIGGGLIEALQKQARRMGVAKVSIHVEHTNPAQRLYRRLGFEQTGSSGVYHLLEWPVAAEAAA